MIIDKIVRIKIGTKNFKYYTNIIENIILGKEYEIGINDVHKGSHTLVNVQCDVCFRKSIKPYRQYLESYNNYNLYCCCPKCALVKNKLTSKEKYDNEYYNNMDEHRKTCLKKYGMEYYLKTIDKKVKSKNTNLNKYGFKSHNSSEIIKIKKKEKLIEKYGIENPSQLDEVKNKKIQTTLINYGVQNPSQSIEVKEKMKQSRILNGFQIPDNKISNFRKYSKKVINDTNVNKKNLFNNWNGVDYYDLEYIKNNFVLDSNDKNYPTIDHKNSIFYGFNNNIDSKEISKIENLCITKRYINSKKGKQCYYEGKKES